MYIKVKHILLVVLVLIFSIVIVLFILYRNNYKNKENVENGRLVEKNYDIDYARGGDRWLELCYIVAQKNGNWSTLPLTNSFKNKYNEKDGILGDIQYDNIEYRPYADTDEDYYFKNYYTYFVITQGKVKIAYIFNPEYLNDDVLLNDVGIVDTVLVSDENGIKIKSYGHYFNDNSYTFCFYMLSRGGDDELSVAVTDNFHKKYPYFIDLFIHYSPLEFNEIRFNVGNFDDRVAYFIVDSRLECIKREYEVKFVIDDKGYLDDATATCINEEKYEREYLHDPGDIVIFKNSNWNNLRITNKFKNKYNPKDGCFPEIDNINIDIFSQGYENISGYRYTGMNNYTELSDFVYKDGSHKWYCVKYIADENGYLDDIEFIPIEYNGTNSKKAKEIYLKSINN